MASSTAPDINDLDLLREVPVGIDANADPEDFFKQSLIDDGDHQFVLTLGNDGVSYDKQRDKGTGAKTGSVYVKAHIMLKVDDPGDPANGLVCFDRLNSIVFGSKGNSALHAVMALIGNPIPPGESIGGIIEFVKATLAQPQRIQATTEWEAQVEDSTKPKGSKERYRVVLKGQARFPKLLGPGGEDLGKYDHDGVVEPSTGLKATTQVRVIRYSRAK